MRWINATTAVSAHQLRMFGLMVGGMFALIGLWPLLWRGDALRLWGLGLAGLLILPALLAPRWLLQVYRVWMTLGEALGWLNTRIILGVIFYGVFAPVALFLRLRGYDAMHRQWDPDAPTYRVPRTARPASHMTRQF